MKDSASGPDGMPYSVYSAAIGTSSIILENTTAYFSSEDQVLGLDRFNE